MSCNAWCFCCVNCELRTCSLLFARALASLTNTPDPSLKTSRVWTTPLCRLKPIICGQGATFCCAPRNWFWSWKQKGVDQPASQAKSSEEHHLAVEAQVRSKWTSEEDDDDDEDFQMKTKACCVLYEEKSWRYFFHVGKWTKKRLLSLAVKSLDLTGEFSLVVNEHFSIEFLRELGKNSDQKVKFWGRLLLSFVAFLLGRTKFFSSKQFSPVTFTVGERLPLLA